MNISKAKAKDLINASKGKFFSVAFVKKNGDLRNMNCRKGVTKHLNGGELAFNPNAKGLVVVFDAQKKAYRMININTLQSITIDKATYSVE
jgi:hypothetical protein